jgi:hypothetical protein
VSYASSLVLEAAAAASARLALRACSSSTCRQQSHVKRRRLTHAVRNGSGCVYRHCARARGGAFPFGGFDFLRRRGVLAAVG